MSNKVYRVHFDIKRNKREIMHIIDLNAKNMMEAKEQARELWNKEYSHSVKPPHMFHIEVERISEDKQNYLEDGFCELWRNKVYTLKGRLLGDL